jgi:hypothetical protein
MRLPFPAKQPRFLSKQRPVYYKARKPMDVSSHPIAVYFGSLFFIGSIDLQGRCACNLAPFSTKPQEP